MGYKIEFDKSNVFVLHMYQNMFTSSTFSVLNIHAVSCQISIHSVCLRKHYILRLYLIQLVFVAKIHIKYS